MITARSVVGRAFLGVVCAWAVVLGEIVVVALLRWPELASIWELQFGALWLLPSALMLAIVPGTLGGVLVALLDGAPRGAGRLVWALAGAFTFLALAFGATTGRHFDALAMRGGALALASGLGAAGAAWAFPIVSRQARRRPVWVVAGGALAILFLEIVNRFVLVRLYPDFHRALGAVTLLLAPVLALLVPAAKELRSRRIRGWALPLGVVAGTAVLAVTARPAAARLAYFDNFRMLLLNHAPLWGEAVRAAAWLAPPAPMPEDAGCADVGRQHCSPARAEASPGGPSLEGHDILLITIDALRADHVGAYGYSRATTPNIDRLARAGVVFEHAYCATPHTSYSVASLMTGKYMRPLLMQGAGQDSDTLATLLRTYDFKTAAFYPPALFFIDPARLEKFKRTGFGFEYRKVEFEDGEERVRQVARYLDEQRSARRIFLWVHLFNPHEPYVAHDEFPFGDRDIDRYDSEIAAADRTLGALVDVARRHRPRLAVIVSADHGEEFGEHGGRYHGTTVYEEQVRVPLVVWAPGVVTPGRVGEPVQTVDLLPTLLDTLSIPRPPRVRGRSLRSLLGRERAGGAGFAYAETDESTLLAEAQLRLICARKVGACTLFDLARDPEQRGRGEEGAARFEELRERLRALAASHGKYETQGLRAEGKGWPAAIVRGIAGDADAAGEIASLLDDADRSIRQKASELLFQLRKPETAPALRLALRRDEDPTVRRWTALALTRLGEGAPLSLDLLKDDEQHWRRLAALALAEAGDDAGEDVLIDWWLHGGPDEHGRALELLNAFRILKPKDAVWPLVRELHRVRLRPAIAETLAAIGDDTARGPLAKALADERYQSARSALAAALVDLGGEYEIVRPLLRFMGTPDPLENGLLTATRAGVLEHVGGPNKKQLHRLRTEAALGAAVRLVVPRGGNGSGYRVLLRARSPGVSGGEVRISSSKKLFMLDSKGAPIKSRKIPEINSSEHVRIPVPLSEDFVQLAARAPDFLGLRPALSLELVVYASHGVEIDSMAIVPLSDELPPPAPKPWTPDGGPAPDDDAP